MQICRITADLPIPYTTQSNFALLRAAEGGALLKGSAIALPKSIKNDAELEGMLEVHSILLHNTTANEATSLLPLPLTIPPVPLLPPPPLSTPHTTRATIC